MLHCFKFGNRVMLLLIGVSLHELKGNNGEMLVLRGSLEIMDKTIYIYIYK